LSLATSKGSAKINKIINEKLMLSLTLRETEQVGGEVKP
jgi:hypothetical protein